ncbi:MAG: DUF4956 domain-containing protein [Deltaproteobacteria bacterium]|nr:DUF4956 domain-containing protein [Deltaproteobacteria bacterium]
MDEMMKGLGLGESVTSVVTVWQVLIAVLLAAALSLLVVQGYRKVQSEASYSQNLAHSFVLIAMVTSLIMILIGSNMARAFSLVGAMSIIRFRTAIKSPLDVAFVFFVHLHRHGLWHRFLVDWNSSDRINFNGDDFHAPHKRRWRSRKHGAVAERMFPYGRRSRGCA